MVQHQNVGYQTLDLTFVNVTYYTRIIRYNIAYFVPYSIYFIDINKTTLFYRP